MKVLYIGVFKNDTEPAHELAAVRDLSSYGFFTRSSVSQVMTVIAGTVAFRTGPKILQDVKQDDYMLHAYGHEEGICSIMITDVEYPKDVTHHLLYKIAGEFTSKYRRTAYANFVKGDPQFPFPELEEYLQKYQDPHQADSIMKIQKELDETKAVLHNTIESVLQRGEKIDDLVAKSDGLSAQSKMFYTQAKKQNSCCIVM